MGMITPIWFEPENEFQGPGTRISLYFHDNGTPDDLTERRDEVITQLKELQGEALLFVNKLRRINIAVFESGEDKIWSKSMALSDSPNFPQGSELRTSKFDATSGIDSEMVRQFHVTKYDATGLSRNENRSYSETEEGLALYSTSRVVLAFPLDENDEPITEIQDVFAFMPVRKIGFNVSGVPSPRISTNNFTHLVPNPCRLCNSGQSPGHCLEFSTKCRSSQGYRSSFGERHRRVG